MGGVLLLRFFMDMFPNHLYISFYCSNPFNFNQVCDSLSKFGSIRYKWYDDECCYSFIRLDVLFDDYSVVYDTIYDFDCIAVSIRFI